jgi:glycosyltransferase involved in cell wall biosynthesis
MISNKVCLISTHANLDCHIIDGHNGFVFNLNSVDDLVDKLNYVIKNINNDEINKIRLNAYNHVIKNYSIDKIANQYSNLYKKIISK